MMGATGGARSFLKPMTDFIRLHRILSLGALALAPALLAQAPSQSTPARDTGRVRLDTAAILASARPEIEAANAAWLPGLKQHDAKSIAAPYADSGLFIAGNGTVTRGRDAVARMYEARFPKLRPIHAGGIEQDGLTVVAATRIIEWGRGWLEMEPERAGAPPVRSGGSYVTVWERQPDGHWQIVRDMAF
jgi:ketosteroid isomerase-like protein